MILHSNILGETGTPLLILHGFLGMSDNWKTLGRKFQEEGFQVHLIDQRNHGRSFHSDDFAYEFLVQDIVKYCQHYQLENISIIGHSMGGKVAMLLAVSHPELISKLLVADISPKYFPTHHQQILEGLTAVQNTSFSKRSEADTILEAYVSDFGTRQFLLKNVYRKEKNEFGLRVNLEVLIENIEEIGESLPTGTSFDGTTLFLKGDKSEYIQNNDEALIKLHFPNAIIDEVSNAGHWLHAENPIEFFAKALRFLKS